MTVDAKNNKETLELELSSSKAKLLKSELKISSLESAIESKSRENSELMTICDELIHKMDKRCTWARDAVMNMNSILYWDVCVCKCVRLSFQKLNNKNIHNYNIQSIKCRLSFLVYNL